MFQSCPHSHPPRRTFDPQAKRSAATADAEWSASRNIKSAAPGGKSAAARTLSDTMPKMRFGTPDASAFDINRVSVVPPNCFARSFVQKSGALNTSTQMTMPPAIAMPSAVCPQNVPTSMHNAGRPVSLAISTTSSASHTGASLDSARSGGDM